MYKGTETTLTCKITGLSATATVTWMKGSEVDEGVNEGALTEDTQTATLTVSDPQEDTEYTCVVTSGEYPASSSSTTLVTLNTYCELMFLVKYHIFLPIVIFIIHY